MNKEKAIKKIGELVILCNELELDLFLKITEKEEIFTIEGRNRKK